VRVSQMLYYFGLMRIDSLTISMIVKDTVGRISTTDTSYKSGIRCTAILNTHTIVSTNRPAELQLPIRDKS